MNDYATKILLYFYKNMSQGDENVIGYGILYY